jgi:hypothetical protein
MVQGMNVLSDRYDFLDWGPGQSWRSAGQGSTKNAYNDAPCKIWTRDFNMYVTITILDFIHNPVFYLKHDVSETGFCPRLQVEPSHLNPLMENVIDYVVTAIGVLYFDFLLPVGDKFGRSRVWPLEQNDECLLSVCSISLSSVAPTAFVPLPDCLFKWISE